MSACTYAGVQCAAVSTQLPEIRLPLQKDERPIRMAAWCGNWPSIAGRQFTICGGWIVGDTSEIQMNPLVLISLTTKFVYMPTHKILHNS